MGVLAATALMAAAGCGGGRAVPTGPAGGSSNLAMCGAHPVDCNSGRTAPGGTLAYALEKPLNAAPTTATA